MGRRGVGMAGVRFAADVLVNSEPRKGRPLTRSLASREIVIEVLRVGGVIGQAQLDHQRYGLGLTV